MIPYMVTWTIEVSVLANNKGEAEMNARQLVSEMPEEFDVMEMVSIDPLDIQELDEHGNPII